MSPCHDFHRRLLLISLSACRHVFLNSVVFEEIILKMVNIWQHGSVWSKIKPTFQPLVNVRGGTSLYSFTL